MTGQEHYEEAEALLSQADGLDLNRDAAELSLLLSYAQVHATLAHAAPAAPPELPRDTPQRRPWGVKL